MMPGRAIGSTRKSETASRPKKRKRWTPKAAAEPRISASTVAATPAFTESQRADLTAGSSQATRNQCVVKLADGPALHVRAVEGEDDDRRDRHEQEQQHADHPGDEYGPGHAPFHLHRLEGAERPCPEEVGDHDHYGHDGERGGKGEIVGEADVVVDDVADEVGARSRADEQVV